ncbi:MAG: signal peptidase I [Anaerolinea sp.]|nr:signal peptidase I [Anaerolinea sp.]
MTTIELPARRPRLHNPSLFREIVETVILIGLVYTLVNLATVRFYIEGPSMQPNFWAEQFLIVSRVHYLFGNPQRGDIIVFDPPGDDDSANNPLLIKRVIGEPFDVIEIREGQVYVNGVPLNEPYIKEPCTTSSCNDSRWELGADEYFMMGDNRNNSRDSRTFGPIVRERIIGEAIVRYWPLTDLGLVTRYRFPD